MTSLNVYYTTKRPGYVVQEFKDEGLVKYDAEYLTKYDKYSNDQDVILNMNRLAILELHIAIPESILDVGFGNGQFLKQCRLRHRGLDLYGYDVHGGEAPEGTTQIGNDFSNYEFDVVTFFDSLEHVPVHDIIPYLKQFNTKCFMISVPWFHSTAKPEWFLNWKHRRENEHLHFFDSFGLIDIMNILGYNVVHVSNFEDQIRKSEDNKPNILTIIARKDD